MWWGGILKRPIWLSCGNATILPSAQIPPTSLWASFAVNDTSPPISYLHQYHLLFTTSPTSITVLPALPSLHGIFSQHLLPSGLTAPCQYLTETSASSCQAVSPTAHFSDGRKHKLCIQVDWCHSSQYFGSASLTPALSMCSHSTVPCSPAQKSHHQPPFRLSLRLVLLYGHSYPPISQEALPLFALSLAAADWTIGQIFRSALALNDFKEPDPKFLIIWLHPTRTEFQPN